MCIRDSCFDRGSAGGCQLALRCGLGTGRWTDGRCGERRRRRVALGQDLGGRAGQGGRPGGRGSAQG
eukprot:9679490-Alexandrium_andersonii.AAC.1